MSRYKILLVLVFSMLLGNSAVVIAADFSKGIQAYQSGDYKAALAEFTPLAEQGYAIAQNNLGFMYDQGIGVLENHKAAVYWYTLAAVQGHSNAQDNLGHMYRLGRGVRANDKMAMKWYTEAAKLGNVKAQLNVGVMYKYGIGTLKDYVRAYMWCNLSAYNGNVEADKLKEKLVKKMTSPQVSKAQDMSSRCLESNYTDC